MINKKLKVLAFSILFSFLSSSILFAQTVKVRSSNGNLVLDAKVASQGTKLTEKDERNFLVCYEKGYVSRGLLIKEILKAGKSEFNIKLEKVDIPNLGSDSKKILFTKYIDPSNKVPTYYGYGKSIAELSGKQYASSFNEQAIEWGYNILEENPLFKEKTAIPELAIAGEILDFRKETKGTPGFKISLLVNWSVYDIEKQKVLMEFISGGYSNTKRADDLQDIIIETLSDAAIGLLSNKQFIEIAAGQEISEDDKSGYQGCVLPLVTIADDLNDDEMLDKAILSAVSVKTEFGHGSGFMISENGYLLTNRHVVSESQRIEIILNNGIILPAEIINSDSKRDVALLKVNARGFSPLPLDIDNSSSKTGLDVIAIGTPEDLKLQQTVTKGIISGNRTFDEQNYIQTDVSINSGNSGGALINPDGEVIGIIVAKISGADIEGIGFVIPIQEALEKLKIDFK